MQSQLGADSMQASKQAKQQTILSASIASRVYPNQQFVGTIGAIGRDSGRGWSVPTKSGRLATMP